MKLKFFLKIIFSGIIFYLLSKYIDISSSIRILKDINLVLYSLAFFILVVVIFFLGVFKWQYCLKSLNKNVGFFSLFYVYLKSFPIIQFSPAKSGDLYRSHLINKRVGKRSAILSILIDRIFEVFGLLIFLIFSFFLFSESLSNFFPILLVLLLILLVSVLIFYSKTLSLSIIKILSRSLKKVLNKDFEDKLLNVYFELRNISFADLLFIFGISIISWSLTYFAFFLIFESFGVNVNFLHLLAVLPISSLSTILPISFSGLGVREGVGVFLFELLGYDSTIVLNVMILGGVLTQIPLILIGVFLNYDR